MRTLIFSILLSAAAHAQIGGPLIGYVPDGPRLRPMHGLPSAGAVGRPIDAGRDFARIAVSPTQNFAIGTAADTGEVILIRPGVNVVAIDQAAANPDILATSPHGTSAALWFASPGKLQLLSGLPDNPSVRTIDARFLNASPLAIAVSDDAQWAAGLWSAGVYAFGPNNEVIPLQTDPGVVALAFFHNRHDLALATASRALSVADLGGSMQTSILYDYTGQSLSPRAIALSFDNRQAVVAGASGELIDIAINANTAAILDCGCSPESLYGLGGSLFRLTGTGGARSPRTALKLFDAASGTILIVPPALEIGGRQ